MAELKVGLVGLGSMGANHARVLSRLSEVNLVAIADPLGDPRNLAGDVKVVASIEKLLDYELQYCVIASPTTSHKDAALTLISSGIPVLIEKPIAYSVLEAQEIVDCAKENNVIGGVGHIERYNPALQEAKKRILSGELGELFQISTNRQGPFPGRIADVGVIKDLATHDIDLTAWLCENPYTKVSTFAAHKSGREHEDLISCSGLVGESVVVNHIVNWMSPRKERKVTIIGERGTIVVDTLHSSLTIYKNGNFEVLQKQLAHFMGVTEGDVYSPAFAKQEPLVSEHIAFRDKLLGLEAEIVSLESGLETLKVAEAMILSLESKEVVEP
jgi:predicted dehydrogenase